MSILKYMLGFTQTRGGFAPKPPPPFENGGPELDQ